VSGPRQVLERLGRLRRPVRAYCHSVSATAFGETFVTLLVIMDPLGAAPIFVALTRNLSQRARRLAAVRATVAALALVLLFAVFGDVILRYLGVSIHSLSIAGGLLLLLLALEMLRGLDAPHAGEPDVDVALVPLASPLVAGPGAIATAIVLSRRYGSTEGRISVLLGIVCAVAVVGVALLTADWVAQRIPAAITAFLTRVLGLLLAGIGIQLILNGIHGSFG
jgi:multiple antibiotic resistance protein